jgi:hypothetical protein
MLRFLSDWLGTDAGPLSASLARIIGSKCLDIGQRRADLDRFTFLLGGSDGETPSSRPLASGSSAPLFRRHE